MPFFRKIKKGFKKGILHSLFTSLFFGDLKNEPMSNLQILSVRRLCGAALGGRSVIRRQDHRTGENL
jgi:hypothetical protein